MATGTTAEQKATALRIQRAGAKPRAIGKRGFLLWAEAAWPKELIQPVLKAAAKYVPGAGTMPGALVPSLASPAQGGLGFFGDDSGISSLSSLNALTGITVDASLDTSTDPTVPPVSAVTAATPAQPASSGWLSDIANAFKAATVGYLGATQVKDAQTIFNTNLARAQQGLPMIPTNPTQYGLPSPTANIGLTSSAQNTVLIVGGVLAAGLVIAALAKGK